MGIGFDSTISPKLHEQADQLFYPTYRIIKYIQYAGSDIW